MTDTMTTKSRKSKAKAPKLFPDELINQLLAQVPCAYNYARSSKIVAISPATV